MKKIIIVIISVFVVMFIGALYVYGPIVILPTNSSNYRLTLVNMGGPSMKKITLNQYINGIYEKSYILELKYGSDYQGSQKYKMPKLKEGSVTIIIEFSYEEPLEINYADANELCRQGLLLYSVSDLSTLIETDGTVYYDEYVYCNSGKNKTPFVIKAKEKEWSIKDNTTELKKIHRKWWGYCVMREFQKYNNWVETTM